MATITFHFTLEKIPAIIFHFRMKKNTYNYFSVHEENIFQSNM